MEENNVSDDADDECYDSYRNQDLPEGYTAYGGNGNVQSVYMYDRYEYDLAEAQNAPRLKQSFCTPLIFLDPKIHSFWTHKKLCNTKVLASPKCF